MNVSITDIQIQFSTDLEAGVEWLRPLPTDGPVLTDLAPYSEQVRALALDVIYRHPNMRWDVVTDAMRAYCWWPLASPAPEYLARCRSVDWDAANPQNFAAFPVIYASSKLPGRLEELWELCERVADQEDERDGALWALGSQSDSESVRRFLTLVCTTDMAGAEATGELGIFVDSIRRWIVAGWLSLDRIQEEYLRIDRELGLGRLAWSDLHAELIAATFRSHPYPDLRTS